MGYAAVRHKCGLSPLARGTRPVGRPARIQGRFIPAGAGNSQERSQFEPSEPVYPRWRGELDLQRPAVDLVTGLSPLARGTQNRIK